MISGIDLRHNMMCGFPTRKKRFSDYTGLSIPPCGDFAESPQSKSAAPPWLITKTTNINPNSLSLHDEIKMFMKYIEPSPNEVAIRKDIVKRFTDIIESLDPNTTVVPVGSYVTGLNLPTSDIDMVLTSQARQTYYSGNCLTIRTLLYNFRLRNFATKIDDVLHATVPLIRITDKETGIEIDLTEAETHSVKATQAVEKWLKHDGDITRMLIFVIKVFLSVRRCGTTYTGGINSYVLVWMVVAWVNLEWPKLKLGRVPVVDSTRTDSDDAAIRSLIDQFGYVSLRRGQQSHATPYQNSLLQLTATNTAGDILSPDFGEALKGFLKFYGSEFDYEHLAINIEPRPGYTSKKYTTHQTLLSIYDPANPSIDVGAKAYGIKHIKECFKAAYRVLVTKSNVGPKGLLGAMIGGDFTKYIQKRDSLTVRR